MNDTRGFTLLELLMVVIIIAILASIALPQYFKTAERSRASEALQVLATLRGSEQRYKALNAAIGYTATLTDVDVEVPGVGANPASADWTYTVTGAAGGSNAVATRITTGLTIQLDLDKGLRCGGNAAAATAYGLPAGPC